MKPDCPFSTKISRKYKIECKFTLFQMYYMRANFMKPERANAFL